MTVDEAMEFFALDGGNAANRKVLEILKTLQDVGLGYIARPIHLHPLGGEIQRVKLATFLMKDNASESTLFVFDEPTTGLHFHDINKSSSRPSMPSSKRDIR